MGMHDTFRSSARSSFNRTSMESKLLHPRRSCGVSLALLIEPVWNRNVRYVGIRVSFGQLLIEPVWNRNFTYRDLVISSFTLLIEPVWNRNMDA